VKSLSPRSFRVFSLRCNAANRELQNSRAYGTLKQLQFFFRKTLAYSGLFKGYMETGEPQFIIFDTFTNFNGRFFVNNSDWFVIQKVILQNVPKFSYNIKKFLNNKKTGVTMEDRAIPRQTVKVTISLSDGRNISGDIQIDLDTRLSDFMNYPERFIIIRDKDKTLKIINKDHIVDIRLQ